MNEAGLQSGFKLSFKEPWSPQEGFLGAGLGKGAAEGGPDR